MSLCFKRCVTKQEDCFKANVIALTRINIRHVDFFLLFTFSYNDYFRLIMALKFKIVFCTYIAAAALRRSVVTSISFYTFA